MLEETGLPYEAHQVRFGKNEQFSDEFLSLNPNNKIPAILDPNGPEGTPMGLWESGAILIYLAEKTGKFLPEAPAARAQTIQWLMWQMGGLGPMLGQLGFFTVFGGKDFEDKRPMERYRDESKRLLGVLNQRLAGRENVMGDAYTIADMAIWPWIRTAKLRFQADDMLGVDKMDDLNRWFDACMAREASKVAINTPPMPS